MSDVFILGAGFSKALTAELPPDQRMPLLWELSSEVWEVFAPDPLFDDALRAALRSPDGKGGLRDDVEALLTYLASDIPWLSEVDNLRKRARFFECTKVIAHLLRERQTALHRASQPMEPARLPGLAS